MGGNDKRERSIIKYNGKWCWVVNAAHECGFTYVSVSSMRRRNRISWQEAFDRSLSNARKNDPYVVSDKTVRDIALEFGLSVGHLNTKVKEFSGWDEMYRVLRTQGVRELATTKRFRDEDGEMLTAREFCVKHKIYRGTFNQKMVDNPEDIAIHKLLHPVEKRDALGDESEETSEICDIDGEPYLTTDVCAMFHMSPLVLSQLIQSKGSLQCAVDFIRRCGVMENGTWVEHVYSYLLDESEYIERDGSLWTLNRYLESISVPLSSVTNRIKKGESLDGALKNRRRYTTPGESSTSITNRLRGISYVVRGVDYYTISSAAAAVPCNPGQITEYKREHSCTVQEALDYFISRREETTFEGKVYSSAKQWIEEKGLGEHYTQIVGIRQRHACSWEEALSIFKEAVRTDGTCDIRRAGGKIPTSEWLRSRGIPVTSFYKYVTASRYSVDELRRLYDEGAEVDVVTGLPKGNEVYYALAPRKSFNTTDTKATQHCTGGVSRRRVTADMLPYRKISKIGKGESLTYVVECKTCGRIIRISATEAKTFSHSEDFCKNHEYTPREPRPIGDRIYQVGSQIGLTFRLACIAAHTTPEKIDERARDYGWTRQEALSRTFAAWTANHGPWVVGDVMCNTREEVASQFDVSASTLASKCTRMGWTVQQWIDFKLGKSVSSSDMDMQFSGNYSKEATELAYKFDISRTVAADVISFRGTPEAAAAYIQRFLKLFTRVRSNWKQGESWECHINGKRLYTVEDIAQACGVGSTQVSIWHSEVCEGRTWQDIIDQHMKGQVNRHSVSMRSCFTGITEAYTGSNGTNYVFALCKTCGSVLLLPVDLCITSTHGPLCTKYKIPEGIRVPRVINRYIRGSRSGNN